MQSKIPDLAATVAGDASKLAGGAVGIGVEGLITVTQVAKEASQIPGDVAAVNDALVKASKATADKLKKSK